MQQNEHQDTIVALATPQGVSALAVIRLSGDQAIPIVDQVFHGADLDAAAGHTLHFGTIRDGQKVVDEVLVSVFRAPRSFTKEDSIEISCHGSMFIVQQIIKLLVLNGARMAKAGEYTQRAFLNGKFDLAQAEAVADVIHADSEAARKAAMDQMRGGFSQEIRVLRDELIHFASMIELELDFSEEDVEFANRDELKGLINNLIVKINALIQSFDVGNVIKNGVPTVIAGKPNAGKSTLLNALLKEERAIVSEIAGTTRDSIEDDISIGGITFRFIDTAGLRDTTDTIEAIGVARARKKMDEASLILYLFDLTEESYETIEEEIARLTEQEIPFIGIGNKADLVADDFKAQLADLKDLMIISAKDMDDLHRLEKAILAKVNLENFSTGDTIVTNLRHHEQLIRTKDALNTVIAGIDNGVTNDFTAMDIRQALHHLGEITGQITTDDLLDNIFSKFCIGK